MPGGSLFCCRICSAPYFKRFVCRSTASPKYDGRTFWSSAWAGASAPRIQRRLSADTENYVDHAGMKHILGRDQAAANACRPTESIRVISAPIICRAHHALFRTHIHPRFCDTDALGHIGNTVVPVWLLEGRESLLKLLVPDLDFRESSMVVVRTEIDFIGELQFGFDVEITTAVEKIGNSSITVTQDVHQQHEVRCRSRTVLVNFNTRTRKSLPITANVRTALQAHLLPA